MCTDFLLTAADGGFVNGRSMEFGLELNSRPFVRRRGEVMRSPAPKRPRKRDGLQWRAKYGYVGMNALGLSTVVDGLNERGLSVGTLWLPGSEYQKVKHPRRALSVLLVNDWLLGTCASVADVNRRAAHRRSVGLQADGAETRSDPLRGARCTRTLHRHRVHRRPAAHLRQPDCDPTNAPAFPWHLDNVRNYVGLSPWDVDGAKVIGTPFMPTGNGSGLRGIPGYFTPPSRLIRTLFLMNAALQAKDAHAARNMALHILNDTDIPKGVVRYNSAQRQEGQRPHAVGRRQGLRGHLRLPALRRPRPPAHRPEQDRLPKNQIRTITEPPVGTHEATEIEVVVA